MGNSKSSVDNPRVSIWQAIQRGEELIGSPLNFILIISSGLFVLTLFFTLSFRGLWFIPAGLIVSQVYGVYMIKRWRLWAYEHVLDIHQLQRSAEFAGLVSLNSHYSIGLFAFKRSKRAFEKVRVRFDEPQIFIDDPSFPQETAVFVKRNWFDRRKLLIILNEDGIGIPERGFFPWSEVRAEDIVRVTYHHKGRGFGYTTYAGAKYFFRFFHSGCYIDVPLTALNWTVISNKWQKMKLWEFDLLVYIYRGRWGTLERVSTFDGSISEVM